MKNSSPSSVVRLLSVAFALAVASAPAAVPVSVNVIGHLDGVSRQTGSAAPAAGDSIYMAFRLYTSPGKGRSAERKSALWGRQATVALEDGNFDIDLSDSLGIALADMPCAKLADAVDAAVSGGSSTLYLGITPESDDNAEIFPRLKITAVPKAILAERVRAVPEQFSATGGLFSVRRLVVEQPVTLTGSTSYGNITLAPSAQIAFDGGLLVEGPLVAGSVRTGDAGPEMVEADLLTAGSVGLSVTGAITLAGTAVWNGSFGDSVAAGPTVAVTSVSADLKDVRCVGEARVLAIKDFVNGASSGFDATGTDWNILADTFTVVDVTTLQRAESTQFMGWHETVGIWDRCTSVTGGSWEAPEDCLAHFQVNLQCDSGSAFACVQFYVSDGAIRTSYLDIRPNAAASLCNGSGASLHQAVPILLKKGQLVRWLGYNPDKVSDSIYETKHSQVDKIVYRKFNWR